MKRRFLAVLLALGLAASSLSVSAMEEVPSAAVESEAAIEEISAEESEAAAEESMPEALEPAEDDLYINPLYADILTGEDAADILQPELQRVKSTAAPLSAAEAQTTAFTTLEEAGACLRNCMIAREGTFTLRVDRTAGEFSDTEKYPERKDIRAAIRAAALEECSDPRGGDYLRYQFGHISVHSTSEAAGGHTIYVFTYTVSYYTTAEQEAAVDAKAAEILASLDLEGKPEIVKIARIYDYITSHVTYDYDNLDDDSYMLKYTACAAFLDEKAVCQGYALMFYRLCRQAGISARVISGTGDNGRQRENHAWNIVGVNGLYYDADTTWDAGLSPAAYSYFLKCEAAFPGHFRGEFSGIDYSGTEFNTLHPMAEASLAYPEEAKIPVTGITLSTTEGYALYGEPFRIQAAVEPANAFDAGVTFTLTASGVGGWSRSYSEEEGWIEVSANSFSDGRPGTVTVTAASRSNPEIQAVCTVRMVSTAADLDFDAIQLNGNSLSLNGDIGVNFYLNMKDSVAEEAVIRYTINDTAGSVSLGNGLEKDRDTGAYRFTVTTVAKEMRDDITVTAEDADGNPLPLLSHALTTDYTAGYTYSVAKYLALAEQQSDDRLTTLMQAMDNYGKYAQVYFGYHTDGVTPDEAAIADVTAETVISYKAVKPEAWPEGLKYYGSSLTLETETSVNHYFTVEEGHSMDDYLFKVNRGGSYADIARVESGGYYKFTIRNIPAAELGEPIELTVTVKKGASDRVYSLQYSPLSYACAALAAEKEVGPLTRALYNYCLAAKAYFEKA